jgi:hypothetical protein
MRRLSEKEAAVSDQSNRTLDRLGAAAGIAVVLLFLTIIMFLPALPPPNNSIDEIARSARTNPNGILLGSYVGALLTGALLVFGASVAARLRRAEGPAGGWWLVALVGIAGTAVGLMTNTAVTTFVRAVDHGTQGQALWVGYPSGPDGVIIAVPLAVFFIGAGFGALAAGALPRWLALLGVALGGLFTVGAASVTGDEVDGGILGVPLLLGYLGLLVWSVGTSVSLWRGSPAGEQSLLGAVELSTDSPTS